MGVGVGVGGRGGVSKSGSGGVGGQISSCYEGEAQRVGYVFFFFLCGRVKRKLGSVANLNYVEGTVAS